MMMKASLTLLFLSAPRLALAACPTDCVLCQDDICMFPGASGACSANYTKSAGICMPEDFPGQLADMKAACAGCPICVNGHCACQDASGNGCPVCVDGQCVEGDSNADGGDSCPVTVDGACVCQGCSLCVNLQCQDDAGASGAVVTDTATEASASTEATNATNDMFDPTGNCPKDCSMCMGGICQFPGASGACNPGYTASNGYCMQDGAIPKTLFDSCGSDCGVCMNGQCVCENCSVCIDGKCQDGESNSDNGSDCPISVNGVCYCQDCGDGVCVNMQCYDAKSDVVVTNGGTTVTKTSAASAIGMGAGILIPVLVLA